MAETTINPPVRSFQNIVLSKDVAMAAGLVAIIVLLLIPLPTILVDFLVALNLVASIGIMLLVMYIRKPMDFSVFPTVLLLVTLFRLGINMSASRSILLNGEAGNIIATFGNMLVGGNYVVGVVIFLILMIIQFVVINTGAGRVAEVSARFTLDAMPGKQMAIDADLNAGLIDEATAKARRKYIEAEANFYGAMDGASKFVKGDAVAAIIIMLVNVLGGIVIGVLQRGISITDALSNYTLITIGAGLAVQVPALLVSAASGLIVTRSAADSSLGNELFGQASNFNVLSVSAVITGMLVLVPSLPKFPFIAIAVGLGVAAFFVQKAQKENQATAVTTEVDLPAAEPATPEDMLQMVVIDPIELEIGYGLIPLIDESTPENLLKRITGIRRQIMSELGIILPIVRIRDNLRMPANAYCIKVRGQEVSQGELLMSRLLAIPGNETSGNLSGINTTEPAFGLPAVWVTEIERGQAELMGYTVVNPITVLATHLTEVVRQYAGELLTRQMVQEMLNQIKMRTPAAVDGIIPDLLSLGELQLVLRNLLSERLPIRDLGGILEVIAHTAPVTRDPNILSEAVRQTMANTISRMFRDENNTLQVFTLSPQLEATLRSSLSNREGNIGFQIDAALAQRVLRSTSEQMESLAQKGNFPILLCPRELRLAFRRLVEHSLPNLVVLAFSEVSTDTKVKAHGMVEG